MRELSSKINNEEMEKLLEDFEKEFKIKPIIDKATIFELITNLAVHCTNCREQQKNKIYFPSKPFGLIRQRNPKPYELQISGAVTQMVARMLSAYLPKTTRKLIETYANRHLTYDCIQAVPLIQNLYKRISKHMTEDLKI